MHRILISAYGCEPNKGSEQGVGWHWVLEMAKSEELWIVTRRNNRQVIENALPSKYADNVHFTYYDLPDWLRKLKRKEKGLYPYYALWQWGAYRHVRHLTREITFDYCLHLTFGSMWMPTFMYKLPVPFIWGPIGGGESVPFNYIKTLPWRGRLPQYARRFLILCAGFNPLFYGPAWAARTIIARTDDSKTAFPKKYQNKIKVMLETGMDEEALSKFEPSTVDKKDVFVELVYVGRLVALKNVETAIHALAIIGQKQQNIRLTIVGDGPLRASLTQLAQELNLLDRIRFVGTVAQFEAIRIMEESHIFIFPSLKEGGAWSLMEAMAVGLPVICLDTSGMHIITDDECAIRIPPTTPQETTRLFAEAIGKLASSSQLRKQMGAASHQRIRNHFLWGDKGTFMKNLLLQLDREFIQS